MALKAKHAGAWKDSKSFQVKQAGVWKPAQKILLKDQGAWKTIFENALKLVISSDAVNFNVFEELGSPASPVNLALEILAGVTLGSNTTSLPALNLLGFAEGSSVALTNNGQILAAGGERGLGGKSCNAGSAGTNGGDAIATDADLIITNAGNIFAGGGGGGGGGAYCYMSAYAKGGDGGLGQGYNHAKTSGGAPQNVGGRHSAFAGAGGKGGDWASAGAHGVNRNVNAYGYVGGNGGDPGYAIRLNGRSIVWQSGNTSDLVKGAVA